ncbi:MAG: hypothetical protein ACR2RB_12615 [Gammaproteobacteria bacterium]
MAGQHAREVVNTTRIATYITPLLWPSFVLAHTGERGFVMLLPTRLYIVGGALVVAVSFVVALLLPRGVGKSSSEEPTNEEDTELWPGIVTLALLAILLLAGYFGSRDPLSNPLPTVIWSIWWIGLTLLHAVFGNLWRWLNPWRAVYRLTGKICSTKPRLVYPRWLGYWPACAFFFWFAWFELVHPAPFDPARLATAVLIYGCVNVFAMFLFGEKAWLRHGDAFAVFFRMVSWLSPITRGENGRVRLRWPASRLLSLPPLPISGVAFVLLALSSVAFDGFSRTFTWMGLLGENPLEYPGRSALLLDNTLGLAFSFALFAVVYGLIATIEDRISDNRESNDLSRCLVYSLVPIAFGYHFAHYLPAFLLDSQYALRAISDPFANGWNLLGTRDWHVVASFMSNHRSVEMIWHAQVAVIVLAHVCAVFVAHAFALRLNTQSGTTFVDELPSTLLMIGYTMLGLWLLSTPIVA